jgi:hypothetical protein
MTIWLVAAAVATLWSLLALTWLAVLVPLAGRDPTDDPRERPRNGNSDP